MINKYLISYMKEYHIYKVSDCAKTVHNNILVAYIRYRKSELIYKFVCQIYKPYRCAIIMVLDFRAMSVYGLGTVLTLKPSLCVSFQ